MMETAVTSLAEMTNDELFRRYREKKEPEVKQELTLRYLYIVKSIAWQTRDMYQEFAQPEDIINEGVIEIMKGIDRYDPEKDNKFETFISHRIRGMVIDMVRKNDWMPRNYHRDRRQIEDAIAQMTDSLGRTPTNQEVADSLGMDLKRYEKIQSMTTMINVMSLDMSYDDTDDPMLQIPTEDVSSQPEEHFMQGEVSRMLAEGINRLQDKEKMIISLYYVDNLNMSQIADIMEISQPRVSQLHAQAISKLKKHMKA
jgi:RNA polymerase sigma factor for flagellar operon FliA